MFRYGEDEWYMTQNMSPKRRAFVLAEGLLGDAAGVPKVSQSVECDPRASFRNRERDRKVQIINPRIIALL